MKWRAKAASLVDDGFVTWEIEADSPEEAENRGHHLAMWSNVADIGSVEVELIEEDAQAICDKLLEVLQITRNLDDLVELQYRPDQEIVVAGFANGRTKAANVAGDSGIAMIMDIIRQIV